MTALTLDPSRLLRDRGVRRVLAVVLVLNLVVAAMKLALGSLTGSLSLLADSLHALLDASSNVVGLLGIALAARPADAGHPYGHRRYEALATMAIGLLILAGMSGIVAGIVEGLEGQRRAPHISWPSAAGVLVTIVVNLAISRYEAKRGQQLKSALLEADANHTMSDSLGATAVLMSFAAQALGLRWADLAGAFVVAALIGRTAWRVLGRSAGVLADAVQLDPAEVRRVALRVADVRGAHRVRSRGSPDHVQLDLHIHVDPAMSVARAHEVTHAVAAALRERFNELADIVIHTEPADGRESDMS